MIRTILFATDGSNCSERALYYTASLARCYQTRVILVNAYLPAPEPEPADRSAGSQPGPREEAERLMEETASRLKELGVAEVESVVIAGPAVNVITGAAESYQPDMLVIGARGQSLWTGNQLGSVSMAVVQRVDCPVLVVK